jgi:hypothetical protein
MTKSFGQAVRDSDKARNIVLKSTQENEFITQPVGYWWWNVG